MNDTVKPYTDEDVENLRRSVNDVRNHPPTPRVVRRLLATLDERTRACTLFADAEHKAIDVIRAAGVEVDSMQMHAHVLALVDALADVRADFDEAVGIAGRAEADAAALRERLSVVERERDEAREQREATKWARNVLAEKVGELTAEAASLREEVARLRDHALTLDGQLHEAEEARAAAERRAEEAEGRLAAAHRLVLHIDALTDNTVMPGDPDPRDLWCDLRSLLATHPPQQQTPAPADDACTTCGADQRGRTHLHHEECIEALRSRVRELEGRLAEVRAAAAPFVHRNMISGDGHPEWGTPHGDTPWWLTRMLALRDAVSALPSQEQPAASALCGCGHRVDWHNNGGCCTSSGCLCAKVNNVRPAPTSTPEGEPGYDLPPDAPEIPEGEPADDDADPEAWEPGDVVAFVVPSDDGEWRRDSPEYTLQTRIAVGWECWFKDWRVRRKTIYDSDVRLLIESGIRRRYRRIRRASTEERRG